MDTSTGHVVSDINAVAEAMRGKYVALEGELAKNAARRLAGRSEMTVTLKGTSKLATFARAHRKARRALEKQGRKNSRRGRGK